MPEALQPSFAKGEIGPELYGRTDTQGYAAALRTARNVIIHAHGGVSNRAGTFFVGPVNDHTVAPKLIPFEFKTTDTYVLEFGNLYVRVIRNDAHVLETGKTITAATVADPVVVTSASHGFSNGDEVEISGVVGMTEINGIRFVVANKATNTFELTDQVTGTDIDGSAYTAYDSAGTAERVYTVTTPYLTADLTTLKWTQSADVMTLVHPDYEPRELTRTDHDAWALTTPTFAPTVADPASVAVTVNTSGALTDAYKVTAIAEDTFEESLAGVVTAGALTGCTVTAADPPVVSKTSHGLLDGDEIEITGMTQMTEINGRRFIVNNKNANDFELRNEDASGYDAETTGGTVTPTQKRVTNSAATRDNTITWAEVPAATRYAVYKEDKGLYGLIGETELLTFLDDNITADLTLAPPRARNPFQGAGNKPGTVSYYEQRRVFGGSTNNPDTQYFSQTGNQANMTASTPAQDDDAITATLSSRQVNEILHFVPGNDLIVMTSGSEWRVHSGADSAFSAATLRQKPQTNWGTSHLRPIVSGETILFVQENKAVVRSLGFSFEIDGYTGSDMTIWAPHLLREFTAVDWDFVRSPDPTVHLVRSDGQVLIMTFNQEQQVVAWSHWDTRNGKFESVAAIRPSAAEVDDFAYFVVKRVVNGNTVRYIERVASRRFEDVQDAIFVDSSLTYDVPLVITDASEADPVVITSASHGVSAEALIDLEGINWNPVYDSSDNETQPAQLNGGRYFAADIASNTFSLVKTSSPKSISGASKANPVVVTSTAHGYANGDVIGIFGAVGMTEINGLTFTVANKTADTYELTGINGTGYTTYTGSGKAYHAEDGSGSAWEVYVDGGNARVAVTSFTGAQHLIGQTVQVLADGNVVSNITVSATGGFTLTRAASRVHMGLKLIADIETLDIESPGETIQGKIVTIPEVTIRLYKSRGLLVGPTSATLKEMKQREFENYDDPTALLTGDTNEFLKPAWNRNGRLFFRQNNPLPLTILAIIPTIIIGDAGDDEAID